MWDQIAGAVILALGLVCLVLSEIHERREKRQREWDDHVTSTPGMQNVTPATDWDAWADELRGWA